VTVAEPPVRPAGEPPLEPAIGFRHALAIGVAVFTSGAVLLGLEIAASRVVAPFFGNSLYVWGALIGVVLTGLAIGYWAGGALADRLPATWLLLAVMTLGALLVLAVPLVDQTVLEWVVSWDPGPRANPLLAAVILFGPASVVFAGVTPIAVRLLTRSVASAGRTAGRLFAISTAGSIAGTFATAFFLIPEFGTNQLLALSATALLACVVAVAIAERLALPALVGAVAAVAAGVAAFTVAPAEQERLTGVSAQNFSPVFRSRDESFGEVDHAGSGFDVVFQRDTSYHHLAVVDDQDSRYLRFDNSFQSGMIKGDPFETRFDYTDYFHLSFAYNPGARRVLFIGLGGGSAPKRLWRDFPRLDLQVVELDPVVEDVARRYFALPDEIPVEIQDGRRFLASTDERYDVIAIDAYFSDSIPFHLTTREFVELARSRLAPGGVIVSNIIGSVEGRGSKLFRSFVRTYRTSFPTVFAHPVYDGGERDPTQLNNIILVATESAAPTERVLRQRWEELRTDQMPNLDAAIEDRYDRVIPVQDVPTLTDDYAPVDSLLVID
jgi:spermidine synthase